jgi:hypothetical protein
MDQDRHQTDRYIAAVDAKGAVSQAGFVSAQEAPFWRRARRNRRLAEWFSDLTDAHEQSYLRLLLDEDFARSETDAAERWILLKIKNDLMGYGVFLNDAEMAEVLSRLDARVLAGEGA